jgi:pilus assembly protein Flp/PilA
MGEQMQRLRKFVNDESAATAIEYAVIAAGLSIVIVAAVLSIGAKVGSTLTSVQNGFN